MSAAQDSTKNTWPPVLGRSAACSLCKEESLLVLKPIPSAQRAGRKCHEDKAARARKHAWMLGSCMQVQNIMELWHLTAAPPVDDRVSLEVKSAELHACLHEAGHDVLFSDCREKLERPSEAGTMMCRRYGRT